MSGISSGVGLISGIDTASLIDQLMALEQRPVQVLQQRVKEIDTRRAAFMEISAKLLAIRNSVSGFNKSSFFKQFRSSSTNEAIAKATAGETAVPGSAAIRVHSLVSNYSVVSRGFADPDRTAIGAGTIVLESAAARVDRATELAALNGGRGVRRGVILVTDRSGATATVDLSRALTVADVLEAINSNSAVRVRASVTGSVSNGASGDRIVIEDQSGGAGNLTVADARGGFTATDLGIAASAAGPRIDGRNVYRLDASTLLSTLNDSNGVDRFRQGSDGEELAFTTSYGAFGVSLSDFLDLDTDLRALNNGNGVRLGVIKITDRSGKSADLDLRAALTIRDVRDAINAAGLAVSATTVNSRMFITDSSGEPAQTAKNLKIEDLSGHAAADLGILADVADNKINGTDVYRVATVGDVVRAINYASGNGALVEASISADGKGITLRALGLGNSVTVSAGTDSLGTVPTTAADLGLLGAAFNTDQEFTSRPLIGGLNTTLLQTLNGGQGTAAGIVRITDRLGQASELDFAAARTLQDVIDAINADATLSLTASVNASGNGIEIRDESGGSGVLTIEDVSGSLAADLGISGSFEAGLTDLIAGGNLQKQYISRATKLADLNGGAGVTSGTFRIIGSDGTTYHVGVASTYRTVGELLDVINVALPDAMQARINDSGDGIVVVDNSLGASSLKIEDVDGGTAAADLGLLGVAKDGENFIDGSYETAIDVGGGDTLAAIAARINAAGPGFSASVVNTGGTVNPYSLTISSATSGRRGELIIDAGALDLGLTTLTRAQDAMVSVGTGSGSASMLVTSSKNELNDVIPGVTINLLSTGDEDVTVTTERNVDAMVESIQKFVDSYNDLKETLDDKTSFNSETFVRATLFGDATVDQVRGRMQQTITRSFVGATPEISRLFNVGLRLGADNQLELDEQRFRDAFEKSPEEVQKLFTAKDSGFGDVVQKTLDGLTQDFDGVLARKDDLLSDQQELLNDRIDRLGVLLEAKRKRLESQFAGLERSLAALQDQQNALNSLSQLAR
ncbi:MAG: flagellar filament capping protein FliD [Planctomycetota bacterium]